MRRGFLWSGDQTGSELPGGMDPGMQTERLWRPGNHGYGPAEHLPPSQIASQAALSGSFCLVDLGQRSCVHCQPQGWMICKAQDENPEHIMGGCPISRDFWNKIGLPTMSATSMDAIHTVSPPAGLPASEFSTFIALTCWQLWKTRNAVFRKEILHSLQQVLAACKAAAQQWRCRFPRKKRNIADLWCQFFEMAMH